MSRLDRAYTGKLEAGVMRAIVDASMTEQAGERVAFLMSAEIVDVLVGVVAGVVSGSEFCASPSSRRRFCDEVARRLQRRIAAFQDHAAEHGTPFSPATINPS